MSADTSHEVASTILFNGFVTFGTRLGVNSDPINSLRLIMAFFPPQLPHGTRARGVGLIGTAETELKPTRAFNFTELVILNTYCIPTMRSARAPLHHFVVFDVRLDKKTIKLFC